MDCPTNQYKDLHYLKGFGNSFASEALPGAIPEGNLSFTQVKIVPSNLNMDSIQNSSQEQHSQSKEQRIRKYGTTSFVPLLSKDNTRNPNTPIAS